MVNAFIFIKHVCTLMRIECSGASEPKEQPQLRGGGSLISKPTSLHFRNLFL